MMVHLSYNLGRRIWTHLSGTMSVIRCSASICFSTHVEIVFRIMRFAKLYGRSDELLPLFERLSLGSKAGKMFGIIQADSSALYSSKRSEVELMAKATKQFMCSPRAPSSTQHRSTTLPSQHHVISGRGMLRMLQEHKFTSCCVCM